MYLKIVFPPLLQQFWSVWNDCTHMYKSSHQVKNLVVILETELSFSSHVKAVIIFLLQFFQFQISLISSYQDTD